MRTVIACALFFGAAAIAHSATERTFPNFNIAITPPDSWEEISPKDPQNQLIATFRDSGHTRVVTVFHQEPKGTVTEVDDRFIADFEAGVERSGGGKRLSGKIVTVQGIKAYERTGARIINGRDTSEIAETIPIAGRCIGLSGLRFGGGKAAEDPDIRRFMESFRFLSPPASAASRSAAYQFGYTLGQLTMVILAIGGIVWVVKALQQSGKSRPPSPPPFPQSPPSLPK